MPKPKSERKLYERCWGCDATRKTLTPFNAGQSNELPAGSECPLCEDGYYDTGITIALYESIARERDRLLVALFEDTEQFREKYKGLVKRAKERLTQENKNAG